MDKRITNKEKELKMMISQGIDNLFEDAHELLNTTGGDISPAQVIELEVSKNSIYKVLSEQLEQNLPEVTMTKLLRWDYSTSLKQF